MGFLVLVALARPAIFQLFQFVVNGLVLGVVPPVLNQLLQFFHALLGGFHALPDSVGLVADRGKGSVQLRKGGNAMLGKIVDRLCNGFQFIGGVLPLPTLRILPALFSLNA